jgi:hypothetical protein
MAQNTGQNQGPQPNKSIIEARDALKVLLEDQGDYNNLLKTALQDLDRMQKSYIKIAARLDSLNKDSINIKQVNQELARLTQKEYIAKQKVLDLEASISQESKNLLKERDRLYTLALKARNQTQRDAIDKKIEIQNNRILGNIELQNIEHAKVAATIAEEKTKQGQEELNTEKKVAQQLGISGNLMKKFAETLGVGEEAYSAMSLESRKLIDANGKVGGFGSKLKVMQAGLKAGASAIKDSLSDPMTKMAIVVGAYKLLEAGLTAVGNAARKAGNLMAGMTEDSSNVVRGLTSGISSLASNIPLVGGLLSGLIDGFSAVLDLIIGVDDKIVKAGRQIGLTAENARQLNRHFQQVSYNTGDIFTNSKKMLETQVEMTQQMGINNIMSDEILNTSIKLKEFSGLEAQTRAQIAETSIITGQQSDKVVKGVLAQVKGLQRATGIAFNYQAILKEAANQSGVLGLKFAKYPNELTKSLLTVKALGLDLKQVDQMASSFLDFESSISKEFEAQLLTGKNINLQKARQLMMENDLEGAAMEINKQIGSSAEFLKMNRFQQDAMAEAMGMTRDSMADMLKKQEMYSKLGAKGTENSRQLLELGLKRYGNEKALAEAMGEEAYQSLVNASTQEKLAVTIEKIKQSIVDFVEGTNIIEKIENFVNMLTKPENIKGILGYIKNAMGNFIEIASELIASAVEGVGWVKNLFTRGDEGDLMEAKAMSQAQGIRDFGKGMVEKMNTIEVNDAVMLPKSNTIIKKDPLDYTIFTKDPSGMFAGSGIEGNKLAIETIRSGLQEIVQAINSSNKQAQPYVIQVNTTMDAYASLRQMKISYDGDIGSNIDQKTAPYNNMRTTL